jgi:hypothetical protein
MIDDIGHSLLAMNIFSILYLMLSNFPLLIAVEQAIIEVAPFTFCAVQSMVKTRNEFWIIS